jgi:hypothetical protein
MRGEPTQCSDGVATAPGWPVPRSSLVLLEHVHLLLSETLAELKSLGSLEPLVGPISSK